MLDKFRKGNEQTMVVSPFVNIYEKGDSIVLAVEMPGVDKDSLAVHLDGNQLTIGGKKSRDEIGKEYQVLHQERVPAEYRRGFEINTDIDRDKVDAKYEEGILTVVLHKSEKAQPKRIEIKV